MQSRRNAVDANGVKVLSVVNARPEPPVNSVANGVREPSVVNVRPEQPVNQRRERPSRAAGEQSRERGQGAERRQRPSGTSRERGSQSGGRGGQGGPGGFMRMFPVMTALDSDGNGEISPEEIKGAVAALKKLDKNKDGKLTEDELRPNFGGRGGASGQRPSRGGEGRGGQRPSGGGEGRGGQRPSRPSSGE